MRGMPLEDELTPVISRGFNKTNMETLQKVREAWEVVQKKDKELRGSGPIVTAPEFFVLPCLADLLKCLHVGLIETS